MWHHLSGLKPAGLPAPRVPGEQRGGPPHRPGTARAAAAVAGREPRGVDKQKAKHNGQIKNLKEATKDQIEKSENFHPRSRVAEH